MRGLLRFLLVLLCAEWLITFRIRLAPHILLSLIFIAAFRLHLYGFIPFWQKAYVAFTLAVVALAWRLRAFMKGSRSRREFYEIPDDGVPWLMIITRSQRVAFWLEGVIVLVFVLWLAHSTPLVYPRGLQDLPPSWAAWLSQKGEYFANMHACLTWAALLFWNQIQDTAARQPRTRSEAGHARVREHIHSLPQLLTIKELAAEFNRDEAP